jgi:homospermidine synthase
MHGFLVTRNELISIADYYMVRVSSTAGYHPIAHYAHPYQPSDAAAPSLHELPACNWHIRPPQRLMTEEIVGTYANSVFW